MIKYKYCTIIDTEVLQYRICGNFPIERGIIMTKRFQVVDSSQHDMTSSSVQNTLMSISDIEVHIHLDSIMKKRNLSQRDVAKITGLRVGTINSIINNKGTTLNKVQLVALMIGLRITDLSEIIEIKFPKEVELQFKEESDIWNLTKVIPASVQELAMQNTLLSLTAKKEK